MRLSLSLNLLAQFELNLDELETVRNGRLSGGSVGSTSSRN